MRGSTLRFHSATTCFLVFSFPVLVWQSWPGISTSIGGVWAALAAVVLGLVLVVGNIFLLDSDDNFPMALAAMSGSVVVGYLIAVWRLWPLTREGIGRGWSLVIWIPLGLVAVFAVALSISAMFDSANTFAKKRRAGVGLVAGGGAALLVYFVLRAVPSVPAHWPEACAVLAAFVVGVCGSMWLRALTDGLRALLAIAAGSVAPRSLLTRVLRTEHQRTLQFLSAELASSEAAWEVVAGNRLATRIHESITARVSPGFATELKRISPFGLQMMRGADYIVHTRSFDRLGAEIAGLSGGAVGVAGPRGAGKSALLEQYRDGRITAADTVGDQLVIFEQVPVTYEPREYVLYLYGLLCEKVAALSRSPADEARRRIARGRTAMRAGSGLLVSAAWVVAVLVGATAWPKLGYTPPSWLAGGWIALAAAGIATVGAALAMGYRRAAIDDGDVEPEEVKDLADLRTRAERRLRTVRYQQKQSFGSSGKVRLPLGGERTATASQEYQRHPMPYPEIANELRKFLDVTTRFLVKEGNRTRIPVVIIFDELDKMSAPERVHDFLNTVKTLFSLELPGCLFLVSVSEDALARFERRGLPVRDAFDSAFDSIVPVEYLNLQDATRLLAGRVAGLPDPFIALCHVLSGGLPRELLRATRSLVRHRDERTLNTITRSLVETELVMKARALGAIIARRGLAEPYAGDLMNFVNTHTAADVGELLKAVQTPPIRPAGGAEADEGKDAIFSRRRLLDTCTSAPPSSRPSPSFRSPTSIAFCRPSTRLRRPGNCSA